MTYCIHGLITAASSKKPVLKTISHSATSWGTDKAEPLGSGCGRATRAPGGPLGYPLPSDTHETVPDVWCQEGEEKPDLTGVRIPTWAISAEGWDSLPGPGVIR